MDMLDQWQTSHFVKQTAKIVKLLVHPGNRNLRNLRGCIVPDMDDSQTDRPSHDLVSYQAETQFRVMGEIKEQIIVAESMIKTSSKGLVESLGLDMGL